MNSDFDTVSEFQVMILDADWRSQVRLTPTPATSFLAKLFHEILVILAISILSKVFTPNALVLTASCQKGYEEYLVKGWHTTSEYRPAEDGIKWRKKGW